jgi:hypothetical protein
MVSREREDDMSFCARSVVAIDAGEATLHNIGPVF